MLNRILGFFGVTPTDYAELLERGAIVVDVRTTGEYSGGHIKGSLNMPLDRLHQDSKKLKKDVPVITCCASGMRSASAKGFLREKGFEVVNGGSWHGLQSKLLKAKKTI
jgi:rhodanese-related sulfurtransferase